MSGVRRRFFPQGTLRPADVRTIEKQRGRIEERLLWAVAARELEAYLAQDYHWAGIAQMGWLRRWRQTGTTQAAQAEQITWISSLPPERSSPQQIAQLLRGHWSIENGVHRVRDVSYDEDRLHGRALGPVLTAVRNTAMSLLRQQGYRYIPDGWRHMQAAPDRGLHLLCHPLEH